MPPVQAAIKSSSISRRGFYCILTDFYNFFKKKLKKYLFTYPNMSNQEQLQNLSEQIFEIKEKCTDQEYKNLMETLKTLYETQDGPSHQPVFHQFVIPQLVSQIHPQIDDTIHTSNLPQLKLKYKNVIHKGIFCDNCSKGPIVGIRYNCQDCTENYDLCQACLDYHKTTRIHKHTHFGAVVKPQKIDTDCCTIM